MPDAQALEDVLLPRLASLLEQALDIVSSAEAMARLPQVAQLCGEAETLARAATLLSEA